MTSLVPLAAVVAAVVVVDASGGGEADFDLGVVVPVVAEASDGMPRKLSRHLQRGSEIARGHTCNGNMRERE